MKAGIAVLPSMKGRRPRVAVVDDEEDVSTFYRLVLEDAGAEVLVAGEAGAALEALERWGPDVVCLDVLMPGRLGISLYRAIRDSAGLSAVPVLVLSGLSGREGLERLFAGAEGLAPPEECLEKPVEAEVLLSVVARFLGRAQAGS